jgi:cobalt/nickel transport protein
MNKIVLWLVGLGVVAQAHFLTLLPSRDTVWDKNETTIEFNISFMHPLEQTAMNRETPLTSKRKTIKRDHKA